MPGPIDLVVFDLGEVLSQHPPHLDALAAIAGVTPEVFAPAYWGLRDAYDLGGPASDYWNDVSRQIGRPLSPEVQDELTEVDASAWKVLHADSLPLLQDLTDAGVRLALLSNAPVPLADAIRAEPWVEHFEALVFSCDLYAIKPDPASYAAVTDQTGVDPARVLFFDDRVVNVEGARSVGWQAHVWTGHADARLWLVKSGVTLPAGPLSDSEV